jgi:hypothetical protein
VVSVEHRAEKEAQCVTVVVLVDCHFFVSQNEKETVCKRLRERETKREEGKRTRIGNGRNSTSTSHYVSICKCVCDMSQTGRVSLR